MTFVQQQHELPVRLDKAFAMQMPNVFVVPPEEDQAPTWCFFDARNPALSQVMERPETPEITVVPYGSSIDAVVMGKPSSTTSVLDAVANEHQNQVDEFDTESEYEDEPDSRPKRTGRDAANDSDVVEVVKVRRRDSTRQVADMDRQQASHPVRTKTLKNRASRAFKSFKGTLKSKPRSQEVASASSSRSSKQNEADFLEQTAQGTRPRSQTPTATRGSRIFSGLFNPPPLKQRPSVPTFEEAPPASPTYSTTRTSESSAPAQNADYMPHSSSLHDPSLQDEARLQAASPALTTASRKSFRRFSKLNLQKLFTFGGNGASSQYTPSPIPAEDSEADPTTPTLRSVASTPAFSSGSSNSGPETPTSSEYQMPNRLSTATDSSKDDPSSTTEPSMQPADLPAFDTLDSLFESNAGLNLGLGLGIDLDSAVSSSPRHPSSRQAPPATPRRSSSSSMWDAITPRRLSKSSARQPSPVEDEDDEASLEIHLDSLHFDDLSFDATRFTLN